MNCPVCQKPMTPADAVTYRRCEECFTAFETTTRPRVPTYEPQCRCRREADMLAAMDEARREAAEE